MVCPKCQSEIADNSKFCTRCGTKIEKVEMPTPTEGIPVVSKCFKCGAELKPGAKFCAKCGANQQMAGSAAATPKPASDAPKNVAPVPLESPAAPKKKKKSRLPVV